MVLMRTLITMMDDNNDDGYILLEFLFINVI